MSLDLSPLFSRALRIAWAHRVLWVFGFLLAILGGECLRFGGETSLGGEELNDAIQDLQRMEEGAKATILLAVAGAFLAGWLLSIVVGNWALGSLLAGLDHAATDGITSFSSASREGRHHFWSLLVIGFLTGAVGLVVASPSIAAALLGAYYGQPVLFAGACLWLPVAMLVWAGIGLLATVAQLHAVIAGVGPLSAIAQAWRFLASHLGDLMLVWAANDAGVGCAAGCATSLLVVIAGVPAWLGFLVNPALGFVLLIPSLIFTLLVMAGRGVVAVFQRAVWLLAYHELRSR